MTINGHPTPQPGTTPGSIAATPRTFRRLVTEIVEVDGLGKEWVLETCEPSDEDIRVLVQAWVEPGIPASDRDHHLTLAAGDGVVGTTPSGEAVRMAEPPAFVQGKPSHLGLPCDKPIANRPSGWRCALPAGHEPESFCDGKQEAPVRMVGADRAEVPSLSDRPWSKEAEFFASGGKLPSERAKDIARIRLNRPVGSPFESEINPSLSDVLRMLDERLGRGGA